MIIEKYKHIFSFQSTMQGCSFCFAIVLLQEEKNSLIYKEKIGIPLQSILIW